MRKIPVILLFATSCLVRAAWAETAIFDADPQHPWNRLHRALYTRPMQDGKTYDHESLDPPFLPKSKFLIEGPSHDQAIAALDSFISDQAAARIKDPLKRAVLQRDLWAVFTMTVQPDRGHQAQRRALQKRLAQVMRQIALSEQEIAGLPDNFSDAVQSAAFPKAYDPEKPAQPFLPPDLLDIEGPWVAVGNRLRPDYLIAPSHSDFTKGRSSFLMLLRLPGGPKAATDYLSALQDSKLKASSGLVVAKETPQIPPATHVALLRRTLLIDDSGALRWTPLVESIQIRVYQNLAAPDVYEFTLRREDLFAGRNGGLHPLAASETAYYGLPFGIVPEPAAAGAIIEDPLEKNDPRPPAVVMKSCIGCHRGPGIGGFQSLVIDHFDTYPYTASIQESQFQVSLAATRKTYEWGLLQGLWETTPKK